MANIEYTKIAVSALGTFVGTGVALAAGVYGLRKLEDHLANRRLKSIEQDFANVHKTLSETYHRAYDASKKARP